MQPRLLLAVLSLACASGVSQAATTFSSSAVNSVSNPVTATSTNSSGGAATSGATSYANQSIVLSKGQMTLPAGIAVAITTTAATSTETGGRLTLRLTPGVTFASAPTATLFSNPTTGGAAKSVAIQTVGTGTLTPDQNGVVYFLSATVTPATAVPANTTFTGTISYIQLSGFAINGANVLGVAGNSVTMSASVGGFTANAKQLNDAVPALGTIATSVSGVTASLGQGPGDTITIAGGAIATVFNAHDPLGTTAGGATGQSTLADLGNVTLTQNSVAQNATGTSGYAPSTSGTLTLYGNFENYYFPYLSSTAQCNTGTPPAGSVPGIVTLNSISFNSLGLPGTAQAICVKSQTLQPLAPTGNVQVNFAIDGITQNLGVISPGIGYAGSAFKLTLLRPASGGGQGYLRLVNSSTLTQPIYAVARGDAGSFFAGLLLNLPAGNSALITQESALAVLGASAIFANGGIGSMVILTPAPALGTPIQGVNAGNATGVSATSVVVDSAGTYSNLN